MEKQKTYYGKLPWLWDKTPVLYEEILTQVILDYGHQVGSLSQNLQDISGFGISYCTVSDMVTYSLMGMPCTNVSILHFALFM